MKNNKFFKKFAATFLAVAILLASAPLSGFAGLDFLDLFNISASAQEYSGTCGDNLTWTFDEATGELRIEGTGDMYGYDCNNGIYAPWRGFISRIKWVSVSHSVTSIGDWVFYNCTALTDIVIPDATTSIGDGAFAGCTALTDIRIPDGVTYIGDYAFCECLYLRCVIFEGSNITHIGNSAFEECCRLREITIPDGVEKIGDSAFKSCREITSVTIPDGVTSIGNSAFKYCYDLASVTIPDSVTDIGDNAFFNCLNLESIKVYEENSAYSSDETGVLFNKEKSEFIQYPIGNTRTDYSIPESVTKICESAFDSCANLKNIIIPNSVICIEKNAFRECECNSIIIQEGITSIGDYAFLGCKATSISIPDSVTLIGESAFEECDCLGEIIIPDSVTSIGGSAFASCQKLMDITLPDKMSGIAYGMFYDCDNLINITLPDSVTSIGDYAFYNCTALTDIVIPDAATSIGDYAFSWCESLTSITIPDSVTSIGYDAFSYCYSLTDVYFGGTEAEWENIAIASNNEYLLNATIHFAEEKTVVTGTCGENITWTLDKETGELLIKGSGEMPDMVALTGSLPWGGYCEAVKSAVIEDGITTVGDNAFINCVNLESITIPDSVVSIGRSAFAKCEKLKAIDLPDNLEKIDSYAFAYCTSLTTITIPDGVNRIESYVFDGCSNLTDITIPEGVTDIANGAFRDCTALESVTISESVKHIWPDAFIRCTALKDVYYNGTDASWSKVVVDSNNECLKSATIHFAEHKHSYTSEITTQSTCTAEGVETFTCECGDSYTKAVPANGHTLSHITVESTCKIAGMEYDLCSECEGVFNSNKLPLADHTWGEWTVTAEPTTENEGTKTRICSVCSEEETESIPKLEVIVNEETGIEIVFGDEYGEGVEVQASQIYDGKSFQLVEANYGNVKTTIFDISTTVDGVAVQPEGKVKVRIPLPEGFGAGKVVVCYVDSENGKVTSIPAKVVDGYVEFETDHFSHYALLATKGKVHSVKIDDVSLYYKDTMFIFPKIKADDGVKYTVEYSSSKPSVAEINQNGQITAKSFGRTTITCTVTDEYGNTVTESFKVNVKYTVLQWIIKLFLFGDLWYY